MGEFQKPAAIAGKFYVSQDESGMQTATHATTRYTQSMSTAAGSATPPGRSKRDFGIDSY